MKKKQSNLHKSNGKKRGPVGIDRPEKILVENEAKNSCEIPSKKLKINDERTSKSETEEVVFSTKIMKRQRELLDEGKLDNSGNKSKKIIEQKNKSKTVSKNYPFDADAKRKLEELKKQCKLDGLSSKNISLIVKKWKRREKRRLARVEERKKDKTCFHCRQHGHTADHCPKANEDESFSVGICFKCGSTEHRIAACKLKTTGFPYAKCFVCNKTGHLSRDCEENPNGAYPEGGNCKRCGKCDHLIKDCPEEFSKEKRKVHEEKTPNGKSDMSELDSNSDKNDSEGVDKNKISVKKTTTKIVKF